MEVNGVRCVFESQQVILSEIELLVASSLKDNVDKNISGEGTGFCCNDSDHCSNEPKSTLLGSLPHVRNNFFNFDVTDSGDDMNLVLEKIGADKENDDEDYSDVDASEEGRSHWYQINQTLPQ